MIHHFLLASLALLLAPGPTNTLLALASAQSGRMRALPLMIAELSAYFLVVTPLALWGAAPLEAVPALATGLRLAAAAWVAALAVRLWTLPAPDARQAAVTWRMVFTTTLLNPKGLVFSLVLLPQGDVAALLPHMGLLAACIAGAALFWIFAGGFLSGRRESGLRRGAACLLGLLAVLLVQATLGQA